VRTIKERNTTRRIAEATRLRETLHYKNERLLSFAMFLFKVQHIFNLFEEEDEPLTEVGEVQIPNGESSEPSVGGRHKRFES